jgi:hypothetical protein
LQWLTIGVGSRVCWLTVPESDEKRRDEEGSFPFWIITAKRKHLVGVQTAKEREKWITALLGAVSDYADRDMQSKRTRGTPF